MTFVSGTLQLDGAQLLMIAVPVQNYITAILVFLIVEQLMTWGFYGIHPSNIRGSLVCRPGL